jgi:amidase
MGGFFVPHDLQAPIPGAADGPLSGLQAAVKDMYAIAGHRTGGGSPAWYERALPAERHCSIVQALLDAGAAIVGKTVCDEFFYSIAGMNAHYGTPANVRAPGRIPGGSSSGSAAAVAAGACDFALGSDTGGSIRIPASLCGIYGIRTTHGRLPVDGVMTMAPSFDTVGWFAPSAGVLRQVGAVLLSNGQSVPHAASVLLVAEDAFEEADRDLAGVLMEALGAIGEALPQAHKTRIAPNSLESWREAFRVVQAFEVWQVYGAFVEQYNRRLGTDIAERMKAASKITNEEADAARQTVSEARRHLLAQVIPGTIVALPTSPCIAPKIESSPDQFAAYRIRTMRLTCSAGLGGLPQISIPIGSVSGCPAGLSLIGWRGGDEVLLDAAVTLARFCGAFEA